MPERLLPRNINGRTKEDAAPKALPGTASADSVVQRWPGITAMPSPILNFEGNGIGLAGFDMTASPPDTEGDVGPNHYVQWVNQMLAIWDKAGNLLYGPVRGVEPFQGMKNPDGSTNRCATDNSGDPLVMYDPISDRWFLSQFAVRASPYYQCVAVSKTPDPVNGGWYAWAFSFGRQFNDYGKSAVWPDAYYMSYNIFGAVDYLGAEVCALDRARMLAGDPAAPQQCFGPDPAWGSLLPSHLNIGGTGLPPAGAPNWFMASGASGKLLLWPFHVDWTTPASSTFPFSSPATIAVAPFKDGCNGGNPTFACVPQGGTAQRLDSLGDRLMWRLNYRNFGTHESIVANHSVDTGTNGPTAIRWYEIHSPGASPLLHQQGTYAPDASSRWMGSVNTDAAGNIALGYSVSSSTMNPSIRYAGRLAADPLGTLPQGEATLQAGTGSQTGVDRWGDYSTMSVDPTDGCTFWYTQEYLATSGPFSWQTRIGSFRFPSCTNGCAAIAGSVTGGGSRCAGTPATVTVTVTVSGGTPPYRVELDSGAVQSGAGPVFAFTVSPATTTTYAVRSLLDAKGCLGTGSGTATVSVVPPPSITTNPSAATACAGAGASFRVSATGSGLSYRWQADGGAGFLDLADAPPYAGAATPVLSITGATAAMNGLRYRAVVSGTCPPAANSGAATLTVTSVVVTPAALPGATAGTAWTQTLAGSGGTAPYTFTPLPPGLPSWLALAPGGALSGTPTVAGSYAFSIAANDSTGCGGAGTAYRIEVAPGPVAVVSAAGGTPQWTLLGTVFRDSLRAAVKDAFGNPVPRAPVTFTAPSSDASGTFPGGVASVTVATDSSGVATAPPLTANGTKGPFRVSAASAPGTAFYDLQNVDAIDIPAPGLAGLAGLALLLVASAWLLFARTR